MEKISGQLGYLQLNGEDGAVLSSSGDLQNDEKTAEIIMDLLTISNQIDPAFSQQESSGQEGLFKKLTITFDQQYSYIVCLSNRRVHIVKKQLMNTPSAENDEKQVDV